MDPSSVTSLCPSGEKNSSELPSWRQQLESLADNHQVPPRSSESQGLQTPQSRLRGPAHDALAYKGTPKSRRNKGTRRSRHFQRERAKKSSAETAEGLTAEIRFSPAQAPEALPRGPASDQATPTSRRGRPIKRKVQQVHGRRSDASEAEAFDYATTPSGPNSHGIDSYHLSRSFKKKHKTQQRKAQRAAKAYAKHHTLEKQEAMQPAVHTQVQAAVTEEARRVFQASVGAIAWTPDAVKAAKKLRRGKRYRHDFQKRLETQLALLPTLRRELKVLRRRIVVVVLRVTDDYQHNLAHGIKEDMEKAMEDFEYRRKGLMRAWGYGTRRRRQMKKKRSAVLEATAFRALIHAYAGNRPLQKYLLRTTADIRLLAKLQAEAKKLETRIRTAMARKVVASFREWMKRWTERAKYQRYRCKDREAHNQKRSDRRRLKASVKRIGQRALLKFSGTAGTMQKGSKANRLQKEAAYRGTLRRNLFNNSVKGGTRVSAQTRLAQVDKRLALRKECGQVVDEALVIKRKLLFPFKAVYLRLLSITSGMHEKVEDSKDQDDKVTWESLLIPERKKVPKAKAKGDGPGSQAEAEAEDSGKDSEEEEETSEPLPEGWAEAVGEGLASLPSFSANVYECMEAVMGLEHCEGCVPEEHCCANGMSGCDDLIRKLRLALPTGRNVRVVRKLLDECVYPARCRIMDIMILDSALINGKLKNLKESLRALKAKAPAPGEEKEERESALMEARPDASLSYFQQHFGETEAAFEAVQADHPVHECQWCHRLVQKQKLVTTYGSVTQARLGSQDGFLRSLRRRFDDPELTAEDSHKYLPLRTCDGCWKYIVKGKFAGPMEENRMELDPIPPEIANLNQYGKVMVSTVRPFVSMVHLKPAGKTRLPNRLLVPGTRGNAVNLRIPMKETLAHVANTAPLAARPQDAFRIFADVKTSAGRLWRTLVNVVDVLKGLRCLKAINPFYKDVTIDAAAIAKVNATEFIKLVGKAAPADPALEAEAEEELEEGEGNPLPVLSQPEPMLTQERPEHLIHGEVTLEPIHTEQVKVGEDVAAYMQKRIVGEPLGHQTPHLDVCCFPELFPRGRGGMDCNREAIGGKYIRPADYFRYRLQHKDPRFRRCFSWKLYAHYYKRDRAIGQGIYACTKTGSGLTGLSAAQLMNKFQKDDEEVEKNLTTLFQCIPGSKEYWCRQTGDLAARDEQYGPATFFMTLSCAETKWPHLADMLRIRNADIYKDVAKAAIADLITKDYEAVSEFFVRRFKAILDILKAKDKDGNPKEGPLGKVEHFYWRLEYQARGAPHIHMKLWVKDAPILGAPGVTMTQVKDFISKYITCEIPSEAKNPRLRKLVDSFQRHSKCNRSCQRFKKGKGDRGMVYCRYGFPRPVQDKYSFNEIDSVVKEKAKGKKPKKMYHIPRSAREVRINDYNPAILMLWGANMDIQFVGEHSTILNGYVTAYMTKDEKKQTEDLYRCLREDVEGSSVSSRLRRLVLQSDKEREVGAYEIIFALLGYALFGADEAVEWLGVCPPEKRKRKFISMKELKKLHAEDPTSKKVLATNLIEDYYVQRHEDLEDLSLLEIKRSWFYEPYDPAAAKHPDSWKMCLDGKGFFRPRKPVVVKTPRVPCTPERAEELFHNLLMEHVPYRAEDELLAGCETFAEAFTKWAETVPALKAGLSQRERVEAAHQLRLRLLKEGADELAAEEAAREESLGEPMDTAPAPQAQAPDGFRARRDYATEKGFQARLASLNAKQRSVWQEVLDQVRHRDRHESGECVCESPPGQVLKFISGGAGVGKSRLIETLTEALEKDGDQVVLAAPSGLAAKNIDGVTLHRAFKLNVQKSKGSWTYDEQSHVEKKFLAQVIGKAKLIVMDEVSMVSNTMLEFIHRRLSGIKPHAAAAGKLFGGMNVVVLGDLLQLPPVKAPYCFEPITMRQYRQMLPGSVGLQKPVNLWAQFNYSELTENMRQKGDGQYADLLNRLRFQDTSEGWELLEKRVESCGHEPEAVAQLLAQLEAQGKKPVCLIPRTAMVQRINAAMLVSKGFPVRFTHALDQVGRRKARSTKATLKPKGKGKGKFQGKKTQASEDPVKDLLAYLKANTRKKTQDTGGIPEVLALAKGARVMLIRNLDVERGLFNGAMGTVTELVDDAKAPDGLAYLKVDFDGVGEETIERVDGTYMEGGIEVKRTQFPLQLSYAITIHKSQGLSLDCVVTDLGGGKETQDGIFDSGMAYVALSRARSLDGLHLLRLDKSNVWCDLKSVTEYNRLRKAYEPSLPQLKARRRERPKELRKRVLSRPLSQAVGAEAPPAKKPRKATAKAPPPHALQPSAPGRPFVPLHNEGNVCFSNAAVQALLACGPVVDWAKAASAEDSVIRHSLNELAKAQEEASGSPRSSTLIRKTVNRAKPPGGQNFENGAQHDSLEFLEALLNLEPSLASLFRFGWVETKQCTDCGTANEMPQPDMLTLQLKRPQGAAAVSWEALLDRALTCERQARCDVCVALRGEAELPEEQRSNSTFRVSRRLTFGPQHRFLVVQLTRNANGGELTKAKVSGFKAADTKVSGHSLRTLAAVIHDGDQPDRGHYYAVTQSDGKWLFKSDLRSWEKNRFLNQLADGPDASAAYLILQRT